MDQSMKAGEPFDNVNISWNTEAVKLLFFQYLCIHIRHTAY